jgi:Uncharacterized protein conserved in bacteria (DUF2188)
MDLLQFDLPPPYACGGATSSATSGLAEDQNGELVVHAQDGSIREKDSHGNDPRDIPG